MSDLVTLLREHWGLADVEIVPLGGGMNSATHLVRAGDTAYVAKQVAPAAREDLVRGCEVAARLAAAGFVTGPAVPTSAGRLVLDDPPLALLAHVAGRELVGEVEEEQRWIAQVLAGVHRAGDPRPGCGTTGFLDEWLAPAGPAWLVDAIASVRVVTDAVEVTWSTLHTDPAPGAFLRDDATGITALVDWAGSRRGPVLYDVASAVMYLGGPRRAAAFLDACGLDGAERALLDDFRRFRWAVQGAYFASRLAVDDRTGLEDARGNEQGLADARRGLAELGVPV